MNNQSKLASGVALKSVLCLSAKPTGITGHDVETWRQRGLGLGSFAPACGKTLQTAERILQPDKAYLDYFFQIKR